MYSQYCDCAKFIYPVESLEEDSEDNNSAQEGSSKVIKKPSKSKSAYLITRGVEILDAEGGKIGKYYLLVENFSNLYEFIFNKLIVVINSIKS
jgi:hypothetical protein